ncbi:hydrogenase maturation factor [Candidatus Methanoperedens nitroreducens]|uniref:Hydrogenase maturation factor n=1 Tax=Candidatus Methanoperedens nitratireducens TaxID=1392998 RepID=A0A062VAL7_9EURY|nr:AIR synthase-related protein [Candidatus Methanoperedens nitroreducens]KCZ72370.1 hydrogenase maturation factor [Candidatus Methanoperedens nitroreducens]MDJ1423696.1 AIR synthase-related protein [Candidatus Methanoperedens sp.]
MDIEGYARRGILRNDSNLKEKLAERILEIKNISQKHALEIASAVIVEARATMDLKGDVLLPINSGVTMGAFGVGSRGVGDFYTHEKIAEVIGRTSAVVDSSHLDDSGVVRAGGQYLVVTIDGMHSRLSDFPFLAGFHVARAALRDVYVMGARPVALLSDIHVADDGDVARIFDHIAGITTVSDLTGIPLVTGSTLRIGGDMVIGERMTGGVGAVGVTDALTARIQAEPGDVILMTEGAGGGTVSTTALYYGMHDIVDETINLKFIDACEALLEAGLIENIHAMTDVTNGGVRGDAKEISRTAGVKLIFEEEKMRSLVNEKVLAMLNRLEIDYLGVSLDALLVIAPPEYAGEIIRCVRNRGVAVDTVGEVKEGKGAELIINGKNHDFTPRFRESAYTPIKKLVGERTPQNFDEMKKAVDRAANLAVEKKKRIIQRLRSSQL